LHRGDPFTNSSRKLAAIPAPGLLLLCPIKIILIVALRLGAVRAKSIDELLTQTAQRRDRTLQWVDSSRPVLPAINLGGSKVLPTVAANSKQLGPVLAAAALSAGVVGSVRPHDLRRGAAKDTSVAFRSVTTQGAAATLGEVQQVLGHSHESLQRGITQGYIGVAHVDNWAPRLAAQLDDPFSKPLMATTAVEDIKSGVDRLTKTPAEVTDLCVKYKLDPTKRSDRLKATRWGEQARLTSWSLTERNRIDEAEPRPDDDQDSEDECSGFDAAEHREGEGDTEDEQDKEKVAGATEQLGLSLLGFVTGKDQGVSNDSDEGYSSMHEDLLQSSLFQALDVPSTSSFETSAPVEIAAAQVQDDSPQVQILSPQVQDVSPQVQIAAAQVQDVSPQVQDVSPQVQIVSPQVQIDSPYSPVPTLSEMTSLEFVRYFSAINLTTSQKIACRSKEIQKSLLNAKNGFSKDDCTAFQFQCKFRNLHRCTYTTGNRNYMRTHESRCKPGGTKERAPDAVTYPCLAPGCGRSFASESTLRVHCKAHDFQPRPCPYGCAPKKQYPSPKALDAHVRSSHPNEFAPARCPIRSCISIRVFKSRRVLEEHLAEKHPGLTQEEIAGLINETREDERDMLGTDEFTPARCPVKSCKSVRTFKSRRVLEEHLFGKHPGLTEEEITGLIKETGEGERVGSGLNSFTPAHCPVKCCRSIRAFKSYHVFEEHFLKKHPGFTTEEIAAMISKTQEDERVVSGDDDDDEHDA
jgi:hypothetical protein